MLGCLVLAACAAGAICLLTWSNADPSFTHATSGQARNALGPIGAIVADLVMQLFGLAGPLLILPPLFWGLQLNATGCLDNWRGKLVVAPVAVALLACAASALPKFGTWPLPYNLGGFVGDYGLRFLASVLERFFPTRGAPAAGFFFLAGGIALLMRSLGLSRQDMKRIVPKGTKRPKRSLGVGRLLARWWTQLGDVADRHMPMRREPTLRMPLQPRMEPAFQVEIPTHHHAVETHPLRPAPSPRDMRPAHAHAQEDVTEDRQVREFAKRFAPDAESVSDIDEPFEAEPPHDAHAHDPFDRSDDRIHHIAPNASGGGDGGGYWPAKPVPPPAAFAPPRRAVSDDLYGRAVAVVLTDRKASNEYLQTRLRIRYMCAGDLLDRMEQEGIVGAPVYNGMRPILVPRPGTEEV